MKSASNKMMQTMMGLVHMRNRTKGVRTNHRKTLYHTRAICKYPRPRRSGNKYGLEAVDLCLILDVGLPTDFKTSEFDKYKGSSCPRVHLVMYCRKMAAYIYDDKVLIHYFQDNLTEIALSWYVSLERGHIKTWRDLTEAFLKQYKYIEDMAPDRFWL
ncbi:hypothetical protein CR513_63041, partial [Mucuna pruriens]